ncbi:hypothetical protein SAMN05444369_1252 [Capnocytophaga haemolytica]|uniref:ABC transporter permease n=1 Tax=Capnocytophaga haemolytica TaxID=45243 RepID=A0AAX2H0D1_9FLAO|nr:hypothetical protein [Capnocytophaga haemolytica]AMD84316.1 hypothetical protein AXF12_01435 [Capnocytophaga haemolytica]SFO34435.1 hypothetical protein SAMN05444369_1252 [Capnocytophaga haemolytica]SNV11887.1 Uncharacterised protein [Capnocytophaga haemolytica]
MLKAPLHLVYVFYRRLHVKGDYLALGLVLGGEAVVLWAIYNHYATAFYALFAFLLLTLQHHYSREDLSLLRLRKNYKVLITMEYLLLNLPALLIFALKGDVLWGGLYLLGVLFISWVPQRALRMPYPFLLFDPWWHGTFRKYRLWVMLPLCLTLIVIAGVYQNSHLGLFALLSIAIMSSVPSFEREYRAHIAISAYQGSNYLRKQLQVNVINALWCILPPYALFVIVFKGVFWWVLPLLLLLPTLGVLTKYAFWSTPLTQAIVLGLIAEAVQYGAPLIALPLLYYYIIYKGKYVRG